eukprot:13979219-Alexandrium_andersonii.AAC.1
MSSELPALIAAMCLWIQTVALDHGYVRPPAQGLEPVAGACAGHCRTLRTSAGNRATPQDIAA